jgi:hypothetical protein
MSEESLKNGIDRALPAEPVITLHAASKLVFVHAGTVEAILYALLSQQGW